MRNGEIYSLRDLINIDHQNYIICFFNLCHFLFISSTVPPPAANHGKGDQFYYKYDYDADNRVVRSLSSRDRLIWTEDASYTYYLHGPLARTELGQYKVQGTDYAYTLQGWLKGINGAILDPAKETSIKLLK